MNTDSFDPPDWPAVARLGCRIRLVAEERASELLAELEEGSPPPDRSEVARRLEVSDEILDLLAALAAALERAPAGAESTRMLLEAARSVRAKPMPDALPPAPIPPPGDERPLPKSDPPPEVREAMKDPKRRIGRYVLLSLVGSGGMGELHRAWDLSLDRPVAIKILRSQSEEDTARFRREATLAGSLLHPNIAAVYEIGEFRGQMFLAMAFIDGGSLQDHQVDVTRAASLVSQAARAVHAAHEKGILHRDVKPGNLMLDREGRLYVTDFGLARRIGDSTLSTTGTIIGTPAYMSPEQARGESHLDARSDVYSLGATLYSLVTGKVPFEGTIHEVLRKVEFEDPVPPRKIAKTIPLEAEIVVQKAMRKEPAERYPTARDLADDLDSFLRGDPILARREPWSRLWRRRFRKNPLAWILAGVLVTAAAVAAPVIFWQRGRIQKLEVSWTAAQLSRKYDETHQLLAPVLRRCDQVGLGGRAAAPEEIRTLYGLAERDLASGEIAWSKTSLQDAFRGWILANLGEEARGEEILDRAVEKGGIERGDPYGSVFRLRWRARKLLIYLAPREGEWEKDWEAIRRESAPLVAWSGWQEARDNEQYRTLVRAIERMSQGRGREAAEIFDRLAVSAELGIDATSLAGLSLYLAGAYAEAEERFRRMGTGSLAWVWIAECRRIRKNLDQAETALKKAHAESWQASYVRGLVRMDRGEEARAIGVFTEVLKRNPRHVASHYQRGLAYLRMGDRGGEDSQGNYRRAETDLRFASEARPGNRAVLDRLAEVRRKIK